MIRRAITEATDEAIAEALTDDVAGRFSDLVPFVRILDRIEGNYSIFLDAPWGHGKTFFVKSAAAILRDGNELIRSERGAGARLANAAKLENPQLPIYFNAWECDYRDEPVASLIETLVDGFEELSGLESLGPDLREKALSIIKSLDVSVGPFSMRLGDACEEDDSSDVTKPLRRDREVRERLMAMLDKVLEERANRVVLFIDELDRCRPRYAVRLLEAVKFLFAHERLTVVFSVDFPMLAEAVRGCYGADFDGEAYLSRFYDMFFRLPAVDPERRLSMARFWARGGSCLWDVSRELVKRGDMSLRDVLKFTDILTSYSMDGAANESQAREGTVYARNVVAPLLLCCQFVDDGLLRRFLSGSSDAFREFWECFESVDVFVRHTELLCQKMEGRGSSDFDSPRDAFVTFICPRMLGLGPEADERLPSSLDVTDDLKAALHKLHLG